MTKEADSHTPNVKAFGLDASLHADESLSPQERNFYFAMQSNGYLKQSDGHWAFAPTTAKKLAEDFKGQGVSFFGHGHQSNFFSDIDDLASSLRMKFIFKEKSIADTIGKYREIDEDQAARIAFILGGIARSSPKEFNKQNIEVAKFIARMTRLGEKGSGDAIASAMAMYALSRGSLEEDNSFVGKVYRMGEAVAGDPIVVKDTADLGLSQVARLRHYLDATHTGKPREFPDIEAQKMAFDGFPTVGAEFHLTPEQANKMPNLWKRLAILNMSQYQQGSYVQLSRNDRDVIEIRMNPSIYPITIANWNHIKEILPELNNKFFTVTINRKGENFDWTKDKLLLNNLRTLGMLSYASVFEDNPEQAESEEIDFGSVYLGQTVKIEEGQYSLSGFWGRKEGQYGQMGIYAGFGNNFIRLTYYLSMALANPDILMRDGEGFMPRVRTLSDALALTPLAREAFFTRLNSRIKADKRLNNTHEAGLEIVEQLKP